MAETKINTIEREYTIPIRKYIKKTPRYDRSRKAILILKRFIAKHMKVQDRDLRKVKLDVFLNNEIWFRGKKSPPSKIKVKVKKEGENVIVDFLEVPQEIKFLKARLEKRNKKPEIKAEKPKIEPKEQKTEEEKKEEKEKEQAVAQQHIKQAEQAKYHMSNLFRNMPQNSLRF